MKSNPLFKTIRLLFPLLERLSPALADRLFFFLFLRTFPIKYSAEQQHFFEEAEKKILRYNGKEACVYRWGHSARTVLFVHGWMGHSAQFQSMIMRFLDEGYSCIAFDAPGHGASRGRSSSMLAFKDAILLIDSLYGSPEMIVAHSLGGAAAILANKADRITKKLVLLNSPATGPYILKSFAHGIGAGEERFAFLKYRIYKELGMPFSQVMLTETIPQLSKSRMLLVYDKDDKVLHFDHLSAIRHLHPKTETLQTTGLGHNRILKDQRVIERCLQFAGEKDGGKEDVNKMHEAVKILS